MNLFCRSSNFSNRWGLLVASITFLVLALSNINSWKKQNPQVYNDENNWICITTWLTYKCRPEILHLSLGICAHLQEAVGRCHHSLWIYFPGRPMSFGPPSRPSAQSQPQSAVSVVLLPGTGSDLHACSERCPAAEPWGWGHGDMSITYGKDLVQHKKK